jgi:hypothetical protein
MKERRVLRCIKEVLPDGVDVDAIFEIVRAQNEY